MFLYESRVNDLITLKDAINKAEKEVGGKILTVDDCDDRWVFGFDFEADAQTGVVFCWFKDTREFRDFFPPDEPNVLLRAKPIELPD